MQKGTLLFIHGTGDRLRDLEPFIASIAKRVEASGINYSLQTAIWGDAIGAEFVGKSLPDPPDEPSGDEGSEYAEWSYLAADPFFGLRLLALPDVDANTDSGLLGKPKWQEKWEFIKSYNPSSDLQALLERGDLTGRWQDAWDAILGDPIAKQAFESSGDNTAEPAQALARAVIAYLIILVEQQGANGPSAALRDKLYDRLVFDWDASVRGISDRIQKFLENTATRLLRDHRAQWSNAASLKIGDILLYQVHAQSVQDFIAKKIAAYAPPVVLMAHSLGGVACVDLLAGPTRPPVTKLITMGSQAPLFFELGALGSMAGKKDLPESFPPWLNFFDRNDFLSYVGGGLFSRVRDFEISSRLPFPKSHSGYFDCDETWDEIKRFLA